VNSVLTLLGADFVPSAAFDYDCKALDGSNDPLVRSYQNFLCVDDKLFQLCPIAH